LISPINLLILRIYDREDTVQKHNLKTRALTQTHQKIRTTVFIAFWAGM